LGKGDSQQQPAELAVGRRWTFGAAVLDERTLELVVGGVLVRVERKPLEVLLYLLHHAGEVVTKDELADNLWPGRILTETVLTRCISQLRQVLKDDDRALIRTVHGFGYRLVAAVKVDAPGASVPPAFAFEPGDSPPQRPQWRLAERLGTGGHGEAWLARHEKTQDARVFKFALDQRALVSLKREITLYRLLHDSFGAQGAIVEILEWNLEEPPYFIEAEYVEGRDLCAWADARGGLADVPLETRLDLVAQIAEALASAHAVGVLHKDLKPGNVLVCHSGRDVLPYTETVGRHSHAAIPRIKLADFGSGGVLDAAHLEKLGITRLGFTGAAATGAEAGATPLYIAPEVMAGQPFTIAADIYALGVMLYQLTVGDLRKPLAPGWEAEVGDELLAEDIALAAAGDPARRLADAAQLAVRLRSLEARRQARVAEAAARERSERAQRAMQELRRVRVFASALLVLAVAAVAGGVMAHRARNDALSARASTQAINHFLTDGVLSVDPAAEKPKDASYESLLTRAAAQVDVRFKDQPEAAASIHWLLGRRFQEVGHIDVARIEYEKASSLLPRLQGSDALPALLALDRLVPIYSDRGRRAEAVVIAGKLVDLWIASYGQANLSTLLLRARLARNLAFLGNIKKADTELRRIAVALPLAEPPPEETRVILQEWLGVTLAADISDLITDANAREAVAAHTNAIHAGVLGEFAEDYRESESRYREALPIMSKLFGENSENTASAQTGLAIVLAMTGGFEEARERIRGAEGFFNSALPQKHWLRAAPKLYKGHIELEQHSPVAALAELDGALALCIEGGCSPRIAEEIQYDRGRAYEQLGQLEQAIDIFRKSLTTYELLRGPDHIGCLKRRISLADALRRAGRLADAASTLAGVTSEALGALPAPHLVVADYKRAQGLLWMENRELAKGRVALGESLEIFEQRLGNSHWRTQRVRAELARAALH
jgi:DNA-binding winged helix-turn-helix (wHTH) protein/tetratricopeptide (TPR) repeat protein